MYVPEDFDLKSYDYELPEELIAQYPCQSRGSSRLMALRRGPNGRLLHAHFSELGQYLPPGCVLVANNSRVIHARLIGKRPSGGKTELLLLTPLPTLDIKAGAAKAEALVRPAGKIKCGDTLHFPAGLTFRVEEKGEFGRCSGELAWQGDLGELLNAVGFLPLPPYIRREPQGLDEQRYQTIYATNPGSVAAPTAGLHFTEDLREKLKQNGIEWVELSLHVGYGTFSPVRSSDIRLHSMHAEYVEIAPGAVDTLKQAASEGRPIVAVGTTSLRALEGIYMLKGCLQPCSGPVNIFIYPGFQFNVVSGLITNFHLPQSTLLMLVAAFAGRERILSAYRAAVGAGYRFFSYGDAMLIA